MPEENVCDTHCECGRKTKGKNRKSRTCTHPSRCACVSAGLKCDVNRKCTCVDCNNPNGKNEEKTFVPAKKNLSTNAGKLTVVSGVQAMKSTGHSVFQGPWNEYETLLLDQVLRRSLQKSEFRKYYNFCAERCRGKYLRCNTKSHNQIRGKIDKLNERSYDPSDKNQKRKHK